MMTPGGLNATMKKDHEEAQRHALKARLVWANGIVVVCLLTAAAYAWIHVEYRQLVLWVPAILLPYVSLLARHAGGPNPHAHRSKVDRMQELFDRMQVLGTNHKKVEPWEAANPGTAELHFVAGGRREDPKHLAANGSATEPSPDAGPDLNEMAAAHEIAQRFYGDPQRYILACIDKFVDEAQGVLTYRAEAYQHFGLMGLFGSGAVLHTAGLIIYNHSTDFIQGLYDSPEGRATHYVVLRVFLGLAFAAAAYAGVKLLISFGAAFFHESTRLLDRRHAYRFGRLFLYMHPKAPTLAELRDAFEWNKESDTIFESISATRITDSTLNQLAKTTSTIAEAITKTKEAARSGKSDSN